MASDHTSSSVDFDTILMDYEKLVESLTLPAALQTLDLTDVTPGVCVIDVAAGTGGFAVAARREQGPARTRTRYAPGAAGVAVSNWDQAGARRPNICCDKFSRRRSLIVSSGLMTSFRRGRTKPSR
jgi:hypothetical protein